MYLSAIIDLYDRYLIAYVASLRNDNRLVFKMFDKEVAAFPNAEPVFYSNHGFQYTSKVFKKKLKKQKIKQSMSGVGHCLDNGPTEESCGIIKSKMNQIYKITDEASFKICNQRLPAFLQ